MEHISLLDPYEQQLLKVFNSHDLDNCGSLDKDGLTQLCQTLQLEEQGNELIKCLLSEKKSRAIFGEFKDALLALLGKMQNNKNSSESPIKEKKSEKSSPDREVSPKFVYGSKKYGRRSRPRTDEVTSIFNEENDISNSKSYGGTTVQRSNSQSEVLSKKRKTNYKLKRCTSLPGHKDLNNSSGNHFITSNLSNEPDIVCTEDMLREAWRKLGVGEDGYLNQTELVLVCDAIGLHKLADEVIRQLSDELSANYNRKISFKEVLEVIQKDETWFDVLGNGNSNTNQPVNLRCSSEDLFPDSRTFQYVTLGPDGNGLISTDTLIEMWENVGIHAPKELIHELGFNSRNINIRELAVVLEKQTRTLNETSRRDFQSPHLTLLQANLSLYQSEIKCLRNILEQLQAEREKLKLDVYEANNRATLLAQEVDDNHTRMEQNTVNQVKLLEQRHADMLRDITSQYTKDKEQLNSINQSLEDKISTLETEAIKLKNDLAIAQKYSLNVEKENQVLSGKICELEKDKNLLSEKIEILEAEKQKVREIEREESEILLAKLTALQIKNSELKDRNDEMESEIESLTNQVISMKGKASSTPTRNFNTLDQSMEDDNMLVTCEGVGLGAKRRNDCSPSKDIQLLRMNGSPRLGKLRKCYKSKTPDNLDVPFTSSESGFDTEPESLSTSTYDNEEINRLQAKVAFLEQVLIQNNIPVPTYEETERNTNITMQLTNRVKELEKTINDVKQEINKVLLKDRDYLNCDRLQYICDKLEKTLLLSNKPETCIDDSFGSTKSFAEQGCQTDFSINFVEEKVRKLEEENQELSAKCAELEDCVELLRNEYEKCEDYWQTKVDEERQFFEAEQKISGDKLNELLEKMREYEEQYANQDLLDNRLPPIVETDNLEKQFNDLEQELEDYKVYHESEMFKKEEEISILKEKLSELALKQEKMQEAAVQADADAEEQRILSKMKSFTSYVIESTCRFADEMVPPQPASVLEFNNPHWDKSTVKSETEASTTSSLPPLNFNLHVNSQSNKESASLGNLVASTSSSQNSTPCRPKRTRKHDKNLYKKSNPEKDAKKTESSNNQQQTQQGPNYQNNKGGEQTVGVPISVFNTIISRRNFLEQRVKFLQTCAKQQHYHNEQTLHYYWQQFRGEHAELHAKLKYCQEKLDQQMKICNEQLDKLHRNDLLVKDLYVENAYLFANVERLEKQCRLLAQASNCSSSV